MRFWIARNQYRNICPFIGTCWQTREVRMKMSWVGGGRLIVFWEDVLGRASTDNIQTPDVINHYRCQHRSVFVGPWKEAATATAIATASATAGIICQINHWPIQFNLKHFSSTDLHLYRRGANDERVAGKLWKWWPGMECGRALKEEDIDINPIGLRRKSIGEP